MTKMLKEFVAIASSDGVMKSKQVIKRYSFHVMNYLKTVIMSFFLRLYKRLGRLRAASLSE